MKVQALFLFVLAVITSIVAEPQFYCGRRLATALVYLCSTDEDSSEDMSKRSSSGPSYPDFIEEEWPLRTVPKYRALKGLRSKRQGVATECCEKPCDLSELLSYC